MIVTHKKASQRAQDQSRKQREIRNRKKLRKTRKVRNRVHPESKRRLPAAFRMT
jgi:hypothetical protein